MTRRQVVTLFYILVGSLVLAACSKESPPAAETDFEETTIATLQDWMAGGELSSEQLVTWYLQRIEAIDANGPTLNAVLELNPDALSIARALDAERESSGARGPMHGIPVILKANIDTADAMQTTAGSLALEGHRAPEDAEHVANLRAAGAVILGKANLSEWANFRSEKSSSGWSSLGGQTRNPYDTSRNPCGSSSGSAVAVSANLATVAVGTETDGSVVCPSGINGIVGIKPTLGLVSGHGIIPIAHSQDTAGPMGRSVADAAELLDAMTGNTRFAANIDQATIDGARIGVIRSHYGAGSNPDVEAIISASISALEQRGATIVDDIRIDTEGMSDAEYQVLLYEFKTGLKAYLERTRARHRTLADIIAFNEANKDTVMPIFGQEVFLLADEKGPLTDADYLEALETSKRLARGGIDEALSAHDVDLLIAPTNGPAWKTDHENGDTFEVGSSSYAAISGYPNITVPAGFASGLPIGLSFIGPANAEQLLIDVASAFEQETAARRPPAL